MADPTGRNAQANNRTGPLTVWDVAPRCPLHKLCWLAVDRSVQYDVPCGVVRNPLLNYPIPPVLLGCSVFAGRGAVTALHRAADGIVNLTEVRCVWAM